MTSKILFLLICVISACSLAQAETIRLSEPVQTDAESETFGAPIEGLPEIVALSDLLQSPDQYLETTIAVKAKVAKVCQKKGCFFIAQQDSDVIRVAFKDYGFFVPTDIGGREFTLVGELARHKISPKQAQHLSKDLGEKGSVTSGVRYEIVATSVRVSAP